jgi:copper chaperone CopZ
VITTLHIDGMRTVHCVRAVRMALGGVPGIASADVRVGRAEVAHDGRATEQALVDAIALVGYAVREVVEERRRLDIAGPSVRADPEGS